MSLYPTPAGQRIPYDRDGSAMAIMTTTYGGSPTSLTAAQMQAANDESTSTATSGGSAPSWAVVFSHLWDLTGYFIQTNDANNPGSIQWSPNTTSGQDGTWNTIGTLTDQGGTGGTPAVVVPNYRQPAASGGVVLLSLTGVKGIRWTVTAGSGVNLYTAHFYGNPSSGGNPDSLRIWQPVTNAEMTGVFDFGDIARAASATQQFRVHNQSATKTASTITCSAEALTDASPSLIGQFQFSTDNITFTNSISIPNLGPGATSAVLYVRDSVAAGAATSVWAVRLVVAAGTFA